MNPWLFGLPFLTALIVALCIRLAARLLFRTIIPRKQDELANKIASAVSSNFSFDGIQSKLTDAGNVKKVMPVVEDHIDNFLRHKLKEKIPMVGMLIGDKTIASLKEVFLKEIEDMFPVVLNKFAGNLGNEINVHEMVRQRLTSIPVYKIQKAFSPIQKYFELAGLIGGFVAGLVALLAVSLT
jgi:uncharacterized membrane protein YheB (UPF0754 family)